MAAHMWVTGCLRSALFRTGVVDIIKLTLSPDERSVEVERVSLLTFQIL
jgi:hypothetical protein